MPIISVAMHQTPPETRKQLIAALTETAAAVTDIPAEKFIVLINELPAESIGIGGRTLLELKKNGG